MDVMVIEDWKIRNTQYCNHFKDDVLALSAPFPEANLTKHCAYIDDDNFDLIRKDSNFIDEILFEFIETMLCF